MTRRYLNLVSLTRVESWLSNETKFKYLRVMEAEEINFLKAQFLPKKETGHFFWDGVSIKYPFLNISADVYQ